MQAIEIKTPRNTSLVESLFAMEGKTAWVIDIWDCHGVLKAQEWGVGKGCLPKLPEGLEWSDIGWFTIPVKVGMKIGDQEIKDIEKVLFNVVNRNGMINQSGFYAVFSNDLKRIGQAYQGTIEEANPDEIVKEMYEAMKLEKNQALLLWSSQWQNCWNGCQGFHEEEYAYFDGKGFRKFSIGCHHSSFEGMWEIQPKPITAKEMRELLKDWLEYEKKDEPIYSDEIDGIANTLGLQEITLCRKHGYYLDGYCEDCEMAKF